MLAQSFLIESSSKLLVTRTGIKARTSSISGLRFPWPIYMFFLNEIWPWHIGLRWAIVALWATCFIGLNGRSGNKGSNLSELNFDVKFCGIEAEDFQATFHILLAWLWSDWADAQAVLSSLGARIILLFFVKRRLKFSMVFYGNSDFLPMMIYSVHFMTYLTHPLVHNI